jgi:hypothetical protein
MRNLNHSLNLLALLALAGASASAQTTAQKAKATGNDVKRAVKKDVHRVGEALCTGTKAECAEQKFKNRVTEAKDTVVDKVK